MRLVTCFDLSRRCRSRFGVSASHTARNSERSLIRCAPQSAWISVHGHAPHLLALRLEEVLGTGASRSATRRSPRASTGPSAAGCAPTRTTATHRDAPRPSPRFAQRVHRHDRVVVELAAVVDAAQARPAQEVVGAEDLEPQVLDRLHLREEAVAADVEAPAVALGGAADPADDGVGLEHRRRDAPLRQHVRGSEPGRTGADHDDGGGRRCVRVVGGPGVVGRVHTVRFSWLRCRRRRRRAAKHTRPRPDGDGLGYCHHAVHRLRPRCAVNAGWRSGERGGSPEHGHDDA